MALARQCEHSGAVSDTSVPWEAENGVNFLERKRRSSRRHPGAALKFQQLCGFLSEGVERVEGRKEGGRTAGCTLSSLQDLLQTARV